MKKNNRVLRIGLLALVLTLVTASLVSGTFAKYVTTVSGTGTVKVAEWVANFQGVTGTEAIQENATFTLIGALNDGGVQNKLVAPGTTGSFDLAYVTEGSQVKRSVKVVLTAAELNVNLSQLVIKKNGTTIDPDTNGVWTLEDTTYGPAAEGNATLPISWEWLFEGDNAEDTRDGIAAAAAGFPVIVTFTATQMDY